MVCSNVERFRYNKELNSNKGGYEHYPEKTEGDDKSLTDSLKELFKKYTLQYENGENILGQIKENCKLDKSLIKLPLVLESRFKRSDILHFIQ